ncbi:ligase-associated DNA damage response exonuclease [Hoeflea sp.]|uniref:ligase-associated DNA damage response exonuclease n=1 Tax=Hoeflea sp. TaxID=1940281 RepID=UPI003B0238B6
MALLEFTDRGIYCRQADVYIDPWKPVGRALITHGHADHARFGHGSYLSTEAAAPVIRLRLGDIALQTVKFGETRTINGVAVSFHPAGHIPGSAQIRIEYKGEVWVVSGDYKVRPDNLSEPFEPIRCHTFISECTFGLPVFKWRAQEDVFADINAWWRENAGAGRTSVLGAYSLGKAQRLLAGIDAGIGPIYTHGAVENTNAVLRAQGLALPPTTQVTDAQNKNDYPGALVIAPPGALGSNWMRRFPKASTGFASGWMALRGVRRRRAVDRGFVLSDHCDWTELNEAIAATGAENIYVTHGYTEIFRRWLETRGYYARIVETEFRGDDLEEPAEGEGASA